MRYVAFLSLLMVVARPHHAEPAGGAPAPPAGSRPAPAAIAFEERATAAGVTFRHARARFHPLAENVMPWLTAGGSGVAVGDFDNDGRDDIYLTTSAENGRNALYRNEGGLRFKDVAGEAGVADVNGPQTGTSAGALWIDYDGDGWQDLLLLRFGRLGLFHNERAGRFRDVTRAAGLERHMNALSAVAFDYDRDGDLDVYIAGYFPPKDLHRLEDARVLFESWETARNGGPNVLFRNAGDGTFEDVTDAAAVQDTGWGMAVAHGDIDNDGWDDLYIANDFGPDTLFRNKGDGTFKDITRDGIGVDTKKGMNAEFGDYNADGWLDIYVTNMTEPYLHECNMLWKNNKDATFTDVSAEEGACDTGWGWGAKFFDADNDGALDIYAANGFISAGEGDYMRELLDFIFQEDVDLTDARRWPPMGNHSMAGHERNVLLRRTPSGYVPVSAAAGVDSLLDSRGVAVSDLDQDGRVDLVVTNVGAPVLLYHNVSPARHNWISLRLRGRGGRSNASAIGARLELRAGAARQYRQVSSGNGFNSQSSLVQHFGLGEAAAVDELSVRWPDGETTTYTNLRANQEHVLTQPEPTRSAVRRP